MKKIVSILICVIMMGMISGCGDNTISDTHKPTDILGEGQVSSSEIESTKEEPTETLTEKETEAPINNEYEIGKTIKFGRYEQDNDFSNGKELIEWVVLDIVDEKALVVSKYALDLIPYNETHEDITWENCTFRKWLNDDFINNAFTDTEEKYISMATVSPDKNPFFDTNPGNATKDKVFILSRTEYNQYSGYDIVKKCIATDYIIAQLQWYEAETGICSWWVRTPGIYQNFSLAAAYNSKDDDDSIDGSGTTVDDKIAVRPAMWIDLGIKEEPLEVLKKEPVDRSLLQVGNYISIGTYEQDNDVSNGEEPIKWIVIDIKGDKALLVSKYALEYLPFNDKYGDITWENCTLRQWLNNEFYNSTFNDKEKMMIPTMFVEAEKHPDFDNSPGNSTYDKIFLLSVNEVNTYCIDYKRCSATDYVEEKLYIKRAYNGCDWWQRSPGWQQCYAGLASWDGYNSSTNADCYRAVRPAMWINLNT